MFITKSKAIQDNLNSHVNKQIPPSLKYENNADFLQVIIKDEPMTSILFEPFEMSEVVECPELKPPMTSIKRKFKSIEGEELPKKMKKSSDSLVICTECGVMLSTKHSLKNHIAR